MNQSRNSEQPHSIHTAGDVYIAGDVETGDGSFVGRDFIQHVKEHITITGDGNVVGAGNTIVQHRGNVYIIQIEGRERYFSIADLRRLLALPLDSEEALNRYCAGVKRRHGTMRIFGQLEAVSVEGIFTHLNILEKPQAWERELRREREGVDGL